MSLTRHLSEAIRFVGLPRSARRIVFYSDGAEYWTHLGDLLAATLDITGNDVCYLSSDPGDPGLVLTSPRLRAFRTDRGRIRDWLLANLDTDLCVLTTPDLDRFQVKRSRHPVHYVYVQHSLVSLHMAYRTGAFDYYDTLFCAGPHHLREARALEAQRGTPAKSLVEHGYGRFDALRAAMTPGARTGERPHVLVAPSWGDNGLLERFGAPLVAPLLEAGLAVTVRPHPQTARLRPEVVAAFVARFSSEPLFTLDTDPNGWASLQVADTMVSDWSGAALEYALARRRPVIFIDTPPKANNPDHGLLGLTPVEIGIRAELGMIVSEDDLGTLPDVVRTCVARPDLPVELVERHVFNPGRSAAVGAKYLAGLLKSTEGDARP